MSGFEAELSRLAGPWGEAARVLGDFAERNRSLQGTVGAMIAAHGLIVESMSRGEVVFVCGNGGSFCDALHIKAELGKAFERARPLADAAVLKRLAGLPMGSELAGGLEVGVPVVVLGESHGLATAYANDRDPVLGMAQELLGFVCRRAEGVLVGISTSGEARNVLAAMSLARAYELGTISLTGPDGGSIARLAQVAIRSPGGSVAEVQENHVRIYHALCRAVEASLFGGGG